MKTNNFIKSLIALFIVCTSISCETEQEENLEPVTLTIGETSSSGGIVFYDKGEYTDGWRYIEAAPEDILGLIEWGCVNASVTNARSLDIGAGKANTEAIVAFHDSLNDYYSNPAICSTMSNGTVAAKSVSDLNINGFDDWYLPSENEVDLMYQNLHLQGLGNFDDANGESGLSLYWTSTEHDDNTATAVDFSNGTKGWNCKQCTFNLTRIRAIRYF